MRSTEEEQIPRWQELAQLAADGEATPAEQAELERVTADSTEAREFARSLRQMVTELRAMDILEPSQPLGARIIARLRLRTVDQPRPSVHDVRPAATRRRWISGIGWAVAAAAITVIALLPALRHGPSRDIAPADVAGTIASVAPESWPVVSRKTADGVSLTVRRRGALASIELAVPAGTTQPVTLRWDPAEMEPAGWPGRGGVTREGGEVRFTYGAGVRGGVLVRPLGPAARIAVESPDGQILKTTISLQ